MNKWSIHIMFNKRNPVSFVSLWLKGRSQMFSNSKRFWPEFSKSIKLSANISGSFEARQTKCEILLGLCALTSQSTLIIFR